MSGRSKVISWEFKLFNYVISVSISRIIDVPPQESLQPTPVPTSTPTPSKTPPIPKIKK